MNALWTAFEILINLFQGWLFVYFLQKKLVQSPKRTIRELNLASICTIIAVAAFYSLYLWFSIPITDSVVCIITFVYSLYAFDTKWYISFLWNAFIGLIIVSVANVTSSLFIRFSGLTWESLMAPSMLRLSFVILSNVLLFVVFYIVSRIIPHQELMSWFSLLLFILLNIIALLAMEMQYNLSWQKVVPQKPVLITIFCLLFIIFGLLILFELLSFKAKEKADLELQIKTSDLKETHLNEMRSLYQNILELRHDMKHQLNTLQAMIEEGRIEESGTYLKSLRMAVMPVSYLTGCVAVDALLSTKVAYMKHLGIEFDYSPYPLNELPISEPSFCSIVSVIKAEETGRSMMSNYIAAIDAGTGGVRCVVFDAQGNAVSQDYREMLTVYTPDGHAEQDPVQLIKGAWDAVRGAIIKGGIDASRIVGVTTTGTQATFAPIDRAGNYLTNIIVWQDARGLEMFPWMHQRLAENGMTEMDLYRRTFRSMGVLLAGAKLLWLREHEPALYDRIDTFVSPQSILLRAFGAEETTVDPTDGGWWLSHDGATLDIDPQLIQVFGLNPAHFPRLCAPGTPVGRITPDVAVRTGLKAGTLLYQGAVDQCCAPLGAGNYGCADMGTLCMGTAGVIMVYSDEPKPDPLGRYHVIHYPGGGYASEIGVRVAASAFRWVRDMLYPSEAFSHENVYTRMDAEAADVPIGSGGLCFLPLMAGSAYPKANDAIRGGWIGASLSTTRAALVRAALEGICYEMHQILESIGQTFASIALLGGATRSELWNQMQADIYGCPVETIVSQEASALGAAMIAAAGAGLYPSLKDAVCGMAHMKRRYEPNPVNSARYTESYHAWLNCLDGLSDRAFPALGKVRNGGLSC